METEPTIPLWHYFFESQAVEKYRERFDEMVEMVTLDMPDSFRQLLNEHLRRLALAECIVIAVLLVAVICTLIFWLTSPVDQSPPIKWPGFEAAFEVWKNSAWIPGLAFVAFPLMRVVSWFFDRKASFVVREYQAFFEDDACEADSK